MIDTDNSTRPPHGGISDKQSAQFGAEVRGRNSGSKVFVRLFFFRTAYTKYVGCPVDRNPPIYTAEQHPRLSWAPLLTPTFFPNSTISVLSCVFCSQGWAVSQHARHS